MNPAVAYLLLTCALVLTCLAIWRCLRWTLAIIRTLRHGSDV